MADEPKELVDVYREEEALRREFEGLRERVLGEVASTALAVLLERCGRRRPVLGSPDRWRQTAASIAAVRGRNTPGALVQAATRHRLVARRCRVPRLALRSAQA